MTSSRTMPDTRYSNPPKEPEPVRTSRALALLPLRLFLGVTFLYAGMQKLTDPNFLRPGNPDFIGQQILTFAQTSPLSVLLLQVAEPHAILSGQVIAYGELALGLGALLGLLLRPASFFGLLLNILLWLSASWSVYPYFYGSDIVFACCWLVLLLNGAHGTGLPTLDEVFFTPVLMRHMAQRRESAARTFSLLLGLPLAPALTRTAYSQVNTITRRGFLWGALAGGISVAVMTTLGNLLQAGRQANIPIVNQATPTVSTLPGSTATATNVGSPSNRAIARVSDVQFNSALPFIDTGSGQNALLIHLDSNQFVAYSARCTHAGCTVSYDSDSKLIVCPCHGASYDPAKQAEVVRPPARRPLASIPIHVDSATGEILPG
ncbi:hypothetical protein KSC_080170 [Ktedonobacter sp. SOSP1-52]|nr:hypothetical protein KSC_080170 [Ktedonobacter sp. SOSP1-52]